MQQDIAATVAEWARQAVPAGLRVECSVTQVIQRLWGNYGLLARVALDVRQVKDEDTATRPSGGNPSTIVNSPLQVQSTQQPRTLPPPVVMCKYIILPTTENDGRALSIGDTRKRRSYEVEAGWYRVVAPMLLVLRMAPVPQPLYVDVRTYRPSPECMSCKRSDDTDKPSVILISDLGCEGYPDARPRCSESHVRGALQWLAQLHGTFLADATRREAASKALWPRAHYFQLDTRREELTALPAESFLRRHANTINGLLKEQPQTICHGDAKFANFVFARQPKTAAGTMGPGDGAPSVCSAAAVDFQYAGLGCGMSDVAYLLLDTVGDDLAPTSTSDAEEHERFMALMTPFLDFYFSVLASTMHDLVADEAVKAPKHSAAEVEKAWRPLFGVAYLDYWRFLLGWSGAYRPQPGESEASMMKRVPGHVRHLVEILRRDVSVS
jgi:hypothetical protein